MSRLRELIHRLWRTLKHSPRDAQLEEEIQVHLEFAARDMERRGHSPEDACRAARVQYGHVAQTMEALRDQRG